MSALIWPFTFISSAFVPRAACLAGWLAGWLGEFAANQPMT
ncbi:MAG: hypothetical protein ACR2ML_07080 [Solirubrobacteraceae bacterium]